MALRMVVRPVFAVDCEDCGRSHMVSTAVDDRGARRSAEVAGWKIRPWGGKGSRTAPDLCPDCAVKEES